MRVVGWVGRGCGSGQPLSDINNAPTAQQLPDMRNGEQLIRLTSSVEASLRQCWLQTAITLNPFSLAVTLRVTFCLSRGKH